MHNCSPSKAGNRPGETSHDWSLFSALLLLIPSIGIACGSSDTPS